MKQMYLAGVILVLLWSRPVMAEEGVDYRELEKALYEQTGEKIGVEELAEDAGSGRLSARILDMIRGKWEEIWEEEMELRSLFMQMMFIGLLISVFQNFSKSFLEQYIGTTGFYIVYMILSAILVRQFLLLYEYAREVLEQLVAFMKILVPTYSMILLSVTGITTSTAAYEFFFLLITLVQWGIMSIILPAIKAGFVLKILNFMSEEDLFSGIIDVLESLIRLLLKGAIMIVLLFNIFQSMLLPAIDSLKSGVIQKGLSILPGAGQVFGLIANTAIGSGIIIKNVTGLLGMLILCMIIFVPVLRIFLYTAGLQIAGAVLQPVTDKHIYQILKQISGSGKLLLQAVLTAAVLFLLTIAILSISSNMNYYVGG